MERQQPGEDRVADRWLQACSPRGAAACTLRMPGAGLISRRTIRADGLFQLFARHDHVDHAVLQQIFRALEALGQLLADGLLDDARAGEADDRAGLGQR